MDRGLQRLVKMLPNSILLMNISKWLVFTWGKSNEMEKIDTSEVTGIKTGDS